MGKNQSSVWNASLTPTKCKRLFLRAITNEKGLINNFFKIYFFFFIFAETFDIIVFVINRLLTNDLLFFYESYQLKPPHRLLASQIRHGNNGDLWCHAACHGYVTIRLLNGPSVTSNHLENRYSQFTWNELTSLKCFSPQFIHLTLAGFILTNPMFFRDYFLN